MQEKTGQGEKQGEKEGDTGAGNRGERRERESRGRRLQGDGQQLRSELGCGISGYYVYHISSMLIFMPEIFYDFF